MNNYITGSSLDVVPQAIAESFSPLILIEEAVAKSKKKPEKSKNEIDASLMWYNRLKELGDKGEAIAEKYLKTIHNNVVNVSLNSSLGYDILADETFYEVKTMAKGNRKEYQGNSFYISINELKVAYENKSKYNLFYIRLCRDQVLGYIIPDLLNSFGLSWMDVLYSPDNHVEGIDLTVNSYKVMMESEFLSNYEEVNLTHYWD